jgi:hypothetical protein
MRAIEEQFDVQERAAATARHAPEKPQVGAVDQFGRQIVRVTQRNQVGCCRTVWIRPAQEAAGELTQLPLALRHRQRAAHRMTSSPPMYILNAVGTRMVPSSC